MPIVKTSGHSNIVVSVLSSPRFWLPLLGLLCVSLSALALLDARSQYDPSSRFIAPIETQLVNAEIEESPNRTLSAFDNSLVIRAQGGSCTQPSSVEISGDNGDTWHLIDGLRNAGLAAILSLDAQRPGYIAATGYESRTCTPAKVTSLDGGVTWNQPTAVGLNYFDKNQPTTIVIDDFEYELGCEARSATRHTETIVALCADQTLSISTDLGLSWLDPISVPHAHAVVVRNEEVAVVNAQTPSCQGVSLQKVTDSELAQAGDCIDLGQDFDPDTFVATTTSNSTLVWASQYFESALDNGKTWK